MAPIRSHGGWVPAFLVLSAVWGSSFLLIKITVDAGVGPIWVGLWRCVLGATALWLICAVSRLRVPRDLTAWGHAAVVALLLNAIPFPLFAYGETKISSVLAGVWNATAPLATLAFAFVLVPSERPSARRLAGMATGFLGVLVVLGIWRGIDAGPLAGTLACLGAAICYGAAFAYARRFLSDRKESATALATIQVTCATLQLALVAPLVEGAPRWPGWGATSALVALGVLGTGVAYQLNFTVIRAAGSTVASTVTYLTPLFSTVLGAVFLSEPVGPNVVAGAVLIILGVVLSRSGPAPGKRPGSRQEPGREQDLDPVADQERQQAAVHRGGQVESRRSHQPRDSDRVDHHVAQRHGADGA
jgi:drug/metabolite transporter (DMT)-like permease